MALCRKEETEYGKEYALVFDCLTFRFFSLPVQLPRCAAVVCVCATYPISSSLPPFLNHLSHCFTYWCEFCLLYIPSHVPLYPCVTVAW